MPRDLSQQGGNPTSALQAQYQQLMEIPDQNMLIDAAMKIVQPLVGRGMSEPNFMKFKRDLMSSAQRGLTNIQMFLSNYILSGSGLSVGRGERGGGMRGESIDQIASIITEDANVFNELTPQQQNLKDLVESCTDFRVILL